MGTCAICGHDVLKEDLYQCEICHKWVCSDCITNQNTGGDDIAVCKDCLQEDDSYAD